ncbi:CDP-glycerol glycerophosphotransferase family protein [uncultured Methanobrevibacter sp.]|uniref:CDP-glycerol glycerophosphotransferase family protein n=1 Tax=uncultured Methanobrevibacter sp. TaxID=253161 RepID=UPI0025F07D37|nr:CDP-glycerol glycerophosphotransferase family protein [uncultured Methanobrevibacter sp.]
MFLINKYIWLFGENFGTTLNNNSYYFWKYCVNIKDDIEKYFILKKTENNLNHLNNLSDYEKQFIVWRDSNKHHKLYNDADLLFISHSYKDVTPEDIIQSNRKFTFAKAFIHLQHGVHGLKQYSVKGKSYGNKIIKFFNYNKTISDSLIENNNFKEYQLEYMEYMPKYGDLLVKDTENTDKNQILWFLTSREYFSNEIDTKTFIKYIKVVLQSEKLIEFLKLNNLTLKICFHKFFRKSVIKKISKFIDKDLMKICYQEQSDLNLELSKSKLLITDYSSIAYDFIFLNRPVLLFQPDYLPYIERRNLTFDINELNDYIIKNPFELIEKISNKEFSEIPYLRNAFPDQIDYDFVMNDEHLKEIYNNLSSFQKNKITFIGYNFYGIGGTVNATMALAEGLLEKGYLVELLSLKRLRKFKQNRPNGLNVQFLYYDKTPIFKEKLTYFINGITHNYGYLKYDFSKEFLHPYVNYRLNELMKKIKSNTIVSTRESLHLYINDCTSKHVNNKIFYFHTHADMIDEVFPNLMEELKQIRLDNALFVTEMNRQAIENKFNYNNYRLYEITGNSLVNLKMIDKDEIIPIEKKDIYNAIYLVRITEDRKDDLDNLINFGKYIKENNFNTLIINVYGGGNYVPIFIDLLNKYGLLDIIQYKGETNKATEKIIENDFMIDFSLNHSFGMTYIEGILNGKKVFCMKNPGSLEVMENIPNSYIESYEWLCSQIKDIDKLSLDELIENYNKIQKKFSRDTVSEKFLRLLK